MTWLVYLWLANMTFCCIVFNLCWMASKNARTYVEERDGPWPSLRSRGTERWNYWTMLLASVTILPFRFWPFFHGWIWCTPAHWLIGDPEPGQPQTPIRRKLSALALYVCPGMLIAGFTGYRVKMTTPDADYSKWLGKNWKQEYNEFCRTKKAGTYVANHTHVLDIFLVIRAKFGAIAFVAASYLKNVYFLGKCISASEGLFIEREGTKDQNRAAVSNIVTRQRELEHNNCQRNPLLIFPEGFTSNNTTINKFKRGAFESLCAV